MAGLPENKTYSKENVASIVGAMKGINQSIRKRYQPEGVDVSQYKGLADKVKSSAPVSTKGLGTVTTPYMGSTKFEAQHPGIDYTKGMGAPVASWSSGKVSEVVTGKKQGDPGFGNYVIVVDDKGNKFRYSHLSGNYVNVGDVVNRGSVLGAEGNCFDKETEILTNDGWKKFDSLNKKEKVATLNTNTLKIEFQHPEKYIRKKYQKMYKHNLKDMSDFVVSDDHNMLIKLHQDQKLKLVPLIDLPNRSYTLHSGFIWEGKEEKYFIIPERKYVGDRWGTIRTNKEIKLDMDKWLSFLGWWLSDGWLCNGVKNKFVGITQSFNNKEKRKILDRLIDSFPIHCCKRKEDYCFLSLQLFDHLKQYGTKNKKKIPKFIFDLSPRQIKIFLDSYWLGDGWNHKGTKYYVFGEKLLADQVQELIMKIGGNAVIKERNPLLTNRKNKAMIGTQEVISRKIYWTITENKTKYSSIFKKRIQEIDYNDYAYCVKVKNSTLYVRRNGKPMWCGNSGQTYSLSGGDSSHTDFRIRDAYNRYVDPYKFINQ